MFALLRTIRKPIRLLMLPIFAILLSACDPAALGGLGGNIGPKIDPNAPVPVALLIPRGGTASDNLLAKNLENAARLAIRDLDGVQIDLRVYGTAGKASTAATAASQAVADGAKIILGPVYGEAANAAGVAVAEAGVNVLSFSNNTTIAGGNVFVLGPTFNNTANRLVSYAKRSGKDKIVVLHANNIGGQLGRNAIQQAVAANGATLAGNVEYALSQEAVRAAVPKVKAMMASSGANALFMTANSSTALPLLSDLLPSAGITNDTSQFIGLTRWDVPAQTLALPGIQGGWFALPDPGATAAFASRYNASYGDRPLDIAGLAFDGIAAIGSLVKSGKKNALTGAALTQGAGFKGANGIFRLLSDGTNQRGLAVATIRNKQVVLLEAAPKAFGGAGF
ncbi:ABC transporter substrate-binding protein [Sulfitobacter donghicola]|uniref:ABC transporter substrate-binding protein n=1 Tax=Sulfitobacter donghicola DSW-25 = KCTC 12864 = JCM 14565 TaxID=1300350 RepID=A0A073IHR3_9RHOB|nr:ABC transporter substrate-binding protein [Sulfitobacter donghicola]KEJ89080.1 ABC transporter substrate-binding protein [Sulfitobacter donghicola DSW-25 = KCTC 12864 = JCM 14565]KIN67344.1 Extracellular ligand-binding receptor [Sulfitobacter donghicola DSW-25 = KCTC 12864 = JCM 14565]